jgi:hypothetical protein
MSFLAIVAGYFLIATIAVLLFSPLLEKRLRK